MWQFYFRKRDSTRSCLVAKYSRETSGQFIALCLSRLGLEELQYQAGEIVAQFGVKRSRGFTSKQDSAHLFDQIEISRFRFTRLSVGILKYISWLARYSLKCSVQQFAAAAAAAAAADSLWGKNIFVEKRERRKIWDTFLARVFVCYIYCSIEWCRHFMRYSRTKSPNSIQWR